MPVDSRTTAELLALDSGSPNLVRHDFWQPGMVSQPDKRGRTWRRVGDRFVQESGPRLLEGPAGNLVPELADAATAGALRGMIEGRRGEPQWFVRAERDELGRWTVVAFRRVSGTVGSSRAGLKPEEPGVLRGSGHSLGEAYGQIVLELRRPF